MDDPMFDDLAGRRPRGFNSTVVARENTVSLSAGPCTGEVPGKRKVETRALSFCFTKSNSASGS